MKTLFFLLFVSPTLIIAQQDSMFYGSGELMNVGYYNESGIQESTSFFYQTGEFKGEAFYDNRGVLIDGYTLNVEGDTIRKSNIPLFNAQPAKDLSFIEWKEIASGVSTYQETKGSGRTFRPGDQVELWHIGYFEDGHQFDNSGITGSTVSFTIGSGRMLKSLESGLREFRSGGSGYIFIPYELAYGDQPMGNLPARSNLIYFIKPTRVDR